jgi:hypothetical protein
MRMPFATAVLTSFAAVSIAMMTSHPARADDCLRVPANVLNYNTYDCTDAIHRCRQNLEDYAKSHYSYWKMSKFKHNEERDGHAVSDCSSVTLVYCSALICKEKGPGRQAHPKLDPSAPLPRGAIPPATQARPPLNSSSPVGWPGVHIPK